MGGMSGNYGTQGAISPGAPVTLAFPGGGQYNRAGTVAGTRSRDSFLAWLTVYHQARDPPHLLLDPFHRRLEAHHENRNSRATLFGWAIYHLAPW